MSDRTPPPIPRAAPLPRTIRVGQALWTASLLAGILVLVLAVLRRTDQFERLRTFVGDLQADAADSTIDTVATVAFWTAVAVLGVLTLIELALRGRAERRAGARWALLLVLLLHAGAAVLGDPLVALGPLAPPSRALLAVQLGLAAAALVLTAIGARSVARQHQAGSQGR
ncbi:hypothetical protein [Naasia sp. SYSU D00057]|uniref:hypothetical protein n=1 Tax=Naasia sp. SYSU D00057 TaxID=2817380 RepID=UPI001B31790B|nr:hypothetical protein [Naasia sp. SYSU D00057]